MKKPASLILNMQAPEGRALIQLSLEHLTEAERTSLIRLMRTAEKGSSVNFGVESDPDSDAAIMKFRIGKPEPVVQ
jgi:hypothetical protein